MPDQDHLAADLLRGAGRQPLAGGNGPAARRAGADITLRQGAAPAEIFEIFEKLTK